MKGFLKINLNGSMKVKSVNKTDILYTFTHLYFVAVDVAQKIRVGHASVKKSDLSDGYELEVEAIPGGSLRVLVCEATEEGPVKIPPGTCLSSSFQVPELPPDYFDGESKSVNVMLLNPEGSLSLSWKWVPKSF